MIVFMISVTKEIFFTLIYEDIRDRMMPVNILTVIAVLTNQIITSHKSNEQHGEIVGMAII